MVSWFGTAKIMCCPLKIRCEVLSVLSVPVRCDEMRERDRKRVNKPHLKSSIARPALQRERLRELQAGRLFLLASDEKGLAILVSPSSGHPFGNAPFQRRSIKMGTGGSALPIFLFLGHSPWALAWRREVGPFSLCFGRDIDPTKRCKKSCQNKRHVKPGSKF